jgi:acetylornithine deacetylase/succinyl-diaminopimelate desuccinylase-like protein
MIAELRRLVGEDVEFEVISHDPGPSEPDMTLFDTLSGILSEADPDGIPVPLLMPAFTDARFFAAGHPDLRLLADEAACRLQLQ